MRKTRTFCAFADFDACDIVCDFRPDAGIRLGPHFFNTDDEVRYAAEQICEIAGAYAASSSSSRLA